MQIFFAGAIRGGRDLQPIYQEAINLLKQYGRVLTEHVGEDILAAHGETEVEMQTVHDRELERLAESDVMVAEVTLPSLGVGYLIASAAQAGKRVVCLFQGDPTFKLTGMILGNKNIEVHNYQNTEDLKSVLQNCFEKKS